MFSEIAKAEGHLIDSQILSRIFDTVIACRSLYEVGEFHIGKTNNHCTTVCYRGQWHEVKHQRMDAVICFALRTILWILFMLRMNMRGTCKTPLW